MRCWPPLWSLLNLHARALPHRPDVPPGRKKPPPARPSGRRSHPDRVKKRKPILRINLMGKVMLAEDDSTMLSLLRTLLTMEGFEAATLGERVDVLEALHRETPDIILLDVNLPQ